MGCMTCFELRSSKPLLVGGCPSPLGIVVRWFRFPWLGVACLGCMGYFARSSTRRGLFGIHLNCSKSALLVCCAERLLRHIGTQTHMHTDTHTHTHTHNHTTHPRTLHPNKQIRLKLSEPQALTLSGLPVKTGLFTSSALLSTCAAYWQGLLSHFLCASFHPSTDMGGTTL